VREVRLFWPTSTLPVKILIVPSSPMWSQAEASWGSALPERPRPDSWEEASFGNISSTMMPPPRSLKKSRRPGANWYAGPAESS
jgi:hypothetical protein